MAKKNNALHTFKFELLFEKIASLHLAATTAVDISNRERFLVRCHGIDSIKTDFENSYLNVLVNLKEDSEAIDSLKEKYKLFDDYYTEIKLTLQKLQPEIKHENNVKNTSNHSFDNIRLPKIDLATFSGDYCEFPSFINMFDNIVHQNPSLSPVQKKHYLLSCLKGEPLNLVKHLANIPENYEVARKLICDRYNNKRMIADTHLNAMLSLPTVSAKNVSNLRSFVNCLQENSRGLSSLQFPVEQWSFLLLHIFTRKLDDELRTKFELTYQTDIPKFNDLVTFLDNLCKTIETSGFVHQNACKDSNSKHQTSGSSNKSKVSFTSSVTSSNNNKNYSNGNPTCTLCAGSHLLFKCVKFISMDVKSRNEFVKSKNLCFNCLRSHRVYDCNSRSRCQMCQRKHNSLLHLSGESHVNSNSYPQRNSQQSSNNIVIRAESESNPSTSSSYNSERSSTQPELATAHCARADTIAPYPSHSHSRERAIANSETTSRHTFLATALIEVNVRVGDRYQTVRALLDPGSMANFITTSCAQRLGLRYSKTDVLISGIGGNNKMAPKGQLHLNLRPSAVNDPPLRVELFVLPKITSQIPVTTIDASVMQHFKDIKLADPQCYERGTIDILLGSGACAKIFQGKKLTFGENLPTAFETIFGWVLMGDLNYNNLPSAELQAFSCVTSINETLQRFWDLEEIPENKPMNPDDVRCENHFKQTHSRTPEGRFVVRLPFKESKVDIGETRDLALRRLLSLERRLKRDDILELKYRDFMNDYLILGHMQPIEPSIAQHFPKYYIPHHGVFKKDSLKLRCVFDASMKSTSGKSLNDVLLVGPKLQQDIVDIILHFRLHEIVFTADIRQMYRQILVHRDDRPYQLILWHNEKGELQEFQLNTVTYGVTSAPYLAIRCLHQLALQGQQTHPRASQILLEDIFVDDICSGADSLEEARDVKNEVVDLLSHGCFELRKWTSNCPQLLMDIPEEHCEINFTEDSHASIKILGFQYNAKTDTFNFTVSLDSDICTKRIILSRISSIYDPNGWLSPCVIFVKILMQRLWKLGLEWDDVPPVEIINDWKEFCDNLHHLRSVSIDRQILSKSVLFFDLHGFSDASEAAYAAVVYMRCVHDDGRVTIHLLIAKTRVAPNKQKLTIPKLELCASHLLARLLSRVTTGLKTRTKLHRKTYAWSDSSIVLCWLRTDPHLLSVFESNRVSQIQNTLPVESWRYVPTDMNPADPASRGISPLELARHRLWWGPAWLSSDEETWPAPCEQIDQEKLPGLKKKKKIAAAATSTLPAITTYDEDVINSHSSFTRLTRVVAWCRRFMHNCLSKKNNESKHTGPLSNSELQSSILRLVKIVQHNSFSSDIQKLKNNKLCSTGLRRLKPFIDDDGMLRVGGRLTHSALDYTSKHPLVLPSSHHLTTLIVDYYHIKYLHVGPSTLMSLLRENYWILSARRVIRSRIFRCLRCFRLKCQPAQTIMGDLPSSRVNKSCRPFVSVGVDFAGHFNMKSSKLRNAKILKVYLCIFVCFTTKAVHLEVVSDLTTEAFLAALKRFVARRGLPKEIWSDSGTNFKGAHNLLNQFKEVLTGCPILSNYLSDHFIEWKFSPPLSPHFNGLAESAVKSSKSHLKRVIGDRNLTFEEYVTIFTQIESILNSRPLCPISDDPTELNALTPGHFIIGTPLVSIPEPPIDEKMTLKSRWHLTQFMVNNIWKRWSQEYLHTLQQRGKWQFSKDNISVGDLVIIKEDNLPPLQWCLGRVTKVFPGPDSVVRVVELKTNTGVYKRSTAKLCPLPFD